MAVVYGNDTKLLGAMSLGELHDSNLLEKKNYYFN